MVGIYDKWDADNANWTPSQNKDDPSSKGGNTNPDDPIKPPDNVPDDNEHPGGFWALFFVLFFIALGAILFKLYGK